MNAFGGLLIVVTPPPFVPPLRLKRGKEDSYSRLFLIVTIPFYIAPREVKTKPND